VATDSLTSSRPFRYFADPICIACLILYAVNRWYFKPHRIGGWFTEGYVNDLICLPLLLPMILYGQRLFRLRKHDGFPRLWEVLQHAVIFSIVFEIIIPRYPKVFTSTADPWDAVSYFVGGIAAWLVWRWAGVFASIPREPVLQSSN